MAAKGVFQPLQVVHRHQMGQRLQLLRDTFRIGGHLGVAVGILVPVLEVGHPHCRIEKPVIGALDQQIAVAPGMGAGQPQGGHHRLGARVGKAHQIDAGHHLGDAVGNDQLAFGREREDAADLDPPARRRIDPVVAVAKDRRPVAKPVIDIAVAVDVPDPPALAMAGIDRAVVAPVAEGRGNAERQTLQRLLILGIGSGQGPAGQRAHGLVLRVSGCMRIACGGRR